MTQKQAAEELGCTTRTVQKAETRINYDNIIDNSCSPAEPPPPPTESRGNTQDSLPLAAGRAAGKRCGQSGMSVASIHAVRPNYNPNSFQFASPRTGDNGVTNWDVLETEFLK